MWDRSLQEHAELDLSDAELQRVHLRAPRPPLCKYFAADAATLSREIETCLTDDAWTMEKAMDRNVQKMTEVNI